MSITKKSPSSPDEFKTSSAESIVLPSDTSNRNHVTGDTFVAGASVEFYEPIAEYEGRHRYDPTAEWTEKEEKRLVRKVRLDHAMQKAPRYHSC